MLGGITLYRTYALYEEKKEFNVLRGKVPSFLNGDLELAMTLDGNSITEVPNQGEYDVNVVCDDKNANAYWDYEKWGIFVNNISHVKVKCVIEFKTGRHFNHYIMSIANTSTEVVKISHEATDQTPSLTDYRYTGKNPNNYVYFGCDTNCTEDNLYRIIGVIPTQSSETGPYEPRVKLIKADYYTEEESGLLKETNATYPAPGGYGYQVNSNSDNKWEESTLQSEVLNRVYWNSLGEYQRYIEPTKWYLGAPTYSCGTSCTPDQFYNAERSNTQGYSKGAISYINNIGLMYPSDYGYSIGSAYKEEVIYNNASNYQNNSWLYKLENKYYEWTMTPENSSKYVNVWSLTPAGFMNNDSVYHLNNLWGIRPTFYLKTEVLYAGGDGTTNNPYRIFTN